MIKKLFRYSIIGLLLFLTILPVSAATSTIDLSSLELKSPTYILYNLEHDEVLAELNSDQSITQASITKIMTVMVALDYISENNVALDTPFTITYEVLQGLLAADASVAGFSQGETVTINDLLYGALLPSGADATRALAFIVSDDEASFVELMNAKAQQLGMTNTVYMNTSGLDQEGHRTTVSDQLILMKYAYANEAFKTLISTKEYTSSKTEQHPEGMLMRSTLLRYFSDDPNNANYFYSSELIGGKTGYTDAAGLCLASVASDGESTYIFINAGIQPTVPSRLWHIIDALSVYNLMYENYHYITLLEKDKIYDTITIKNGASNFDIVLSEEVTQLLSSSIDPANLVVTVALTQEEYVAPIAADTPMALLQVYDGDTLVYEERVSTTGEIDRSFQAKLVSFLAVFLKWALVVLIGGIALLFGLRLYNINKIKRRRQNRYR